MSLESKIKNWKRDAERRAKSIYPCRFNELYVECAETWRCNRCGWNPEVAERRKAAIREKLIPKEPEPGGWTTGPFRPVENRVL